METPVPPSKAYAEAYTCRGEGESVGAGLERVGDGNLESVVVDPRQVDSLGKDALLQILGDVHRGQDAVHLLVLVSGIEVVELPEDAKHLLDAVLAEVALDLDDVDL